MRQRCDIRINPIQRRSDVTADGHWFLPMYAKAKFTLIKPNHEIDWIGKRRILSRPFSRFMGPSMTLLDALEDRSCGEETVCFLKTTDTINIRIESSFGSHSSWLLPTAHTIDNTVYTTRICQRFVSVDFHDGRLQLCE